MQVSSNLWTELRTRDLFWVMLFGTLLLLSRERSPEALQLLGALTVFQLAEPRVRALATPRGNWIALSIKLLLVYLLIGLTDGINSGYWLLLIVPMVSAATTLGTFGTALFTVLACVADLSFAHPFFTENYELTARDWEQIGLRMVALVVVGYLVYQNRVEARRYQEAAEQLAVANKSLREAEEAMRRSERLAALGQLSAGLAHELRNPLGTIRASAEMLQKGVDADLSQELAGFISTEADRTNSLITRFLDFARPLEIRPARADINEVIDRVMAQLRRRDPPLPVTFYTNYSPDVRPFDFDAELMERVFSNLLMNAAQASPGSSSVGIKTREAMGFVEIAVIDRGSGIKPEHRESIFNPFFTTKSEGVGLGLAIVSKIVDGHQGRVEVESEPGQGSVFHVFLPAIRTGHRSTLEEGKA